MRDVTGADGDAPQQAPTTTSEQAASAERSEPADRTASAEQATSAEQPTPGFGERGRMRRRARFLRKARELAYRDLGGLVFDMHRFGQRNEQVLGAKLATLGQIDAELRALEQALDRHQGVTVLREVGIAACPRCAAIHGRDDRFCPGCGLAFDANAERPLATSPMSTHGLGSPLGAHPQGAAPTPSAPGTPATPTAPGAGTAPATAPALHPSPPVVKPTSPPVAAPPAAKLDEDEPTQILHPPAGGS